MQGPRTAAGHLVRVARPGAARSSARRGGGGGWALGCVRVIIGLGRSRWGSLLASPGTKEAPGVPAAAGVFGAADAPDLRACGGSQAEVVREKGVFLGRKVG